MERTTRLATEFVDVNFKVYDCNTGICVDEFNMQCEFPKGWGFSQRWWKLHSYCEYLHRKFPTREFRYKIQLPA